MCRGMSPEVIEFLLKRQAEHTLDQCLKLVHQIYMNSEMPKPFYISEKLKELYPRIQAKKQVHKKSK